MKPRTNGTSRGQKAQNFQGERPNWILIAGGALLSTLSIRLGYKLKQTLDSKQLANASDGLKGNMNSSERRSPRCNMHSNMYSFTQGDDVCFNCISGNEGIANLKHRSNDQMLSESDVALPLVMVPAAEFTKENGVMWVSSPDRLELPPKPFSHSNCSDSPSVSESGSDILSKREVIQKLRQQLRRRDDMILEMQDQILELQNSLNAQLTLSSNLQSQLDAANRDLFDSGREIQRLRKAIADHCVKHVDTNDKPSTITAWPSEARNGHSNGYLDGESNFETSEKGRGDGGRIEMLKREVGDLKEVIEGKEYLLQSYKEQKAELSMKIKELQHRLDSQLPNIL
ncbi:hypothetical protein D5086_024597 [Populus alba]|uniref:Uncharacterized protein n=4 Tax=Populus TaxID=3689 RepID=A0A4V6AA27_POPAL|nr:uncharacterized protein LOC118053560 [Populus alba]KAG6752044.1 hypothetical protein POTOM_044260 [Populus tomentosa]KAJ6975184.1 hypothetical protein NC653_031132 [Populus alba x Populus x berolinensis]TKS09506.1 uncharacterized protein D5086_0000092580 [Populus alba]